VHVAWGGGGAEGRLAWSAPRRMEDFTGGAKIFLGCGAAAHFLTTLHPLPLPMRMASSFQDGECAYGAGGAGERLASFQDGE
jgi:hypothetical protein